MTLHIIGSSSSGNCYILKASNGESLMIECGKKWFEIQEAIEFDIKRVVGCLVTHSHKDHCFAVQNVLKSGIKVYATKGELSAMGVNLHHNSVAITKEAFYDSVSNRKAGEGYPSFSIGDFSIRPFDIVHDTPEPVGFMIYHEECGAMIFITDTVYSPYRFNGLNNIIVEANYCQKILDERLARGDNPAFLRDRVLQSHMSIDNCLDLLQANDLSAVNNIVLIHLSDSNSNAKQFRQRVADATGKTVTVADKGMVIDFDKSPF